MEIKRRETEFFAQVARFLLFFGGFWVLFTGVIMILVEGRMYVQQPWSAGLAVVSLVYVAKVFWRFYADVKNKKEHPQYQFVSSWRDFLLDVGILGILTYLQFQSVFVAENGHITVAQFNALSNVFLALIFHFFRFVYHVTDF